MSMYSQQKLVWLFDHLGFGFMMQSHGKKGVDIITLLDTVGLHHRLGQPSKQESLSSQFHIIFALSKYLGLKHLFGCNVKGSAKGAPHSMTVVDLTPEMPESFM